MKHIVTLIILFMLNAGPASAQPTLTAATTMPAVGLSDVVYNSNQFAAGTAGANQSWDFTTGTYSAPGSASYQRCTASNGCTNYAGATIAYVYGSILTYYKTTANTLSLQGFSNGGLGSYYTNPEDYLRFPFTYGNSFVDSFAGSYLNPSGGGTWYRRGSDSVSADGWGTLKTPAGTFSNVLRIKRVSTYLDSGMIAGFPEKTRYKSYTYTWYSTAYRDFLYTTANITVTPRSGAPTSVNYARYTSGQPLGIGATALQGLRCQVAPNPAKDHVQAVLRLDASARPSFSLTDITGRVVRSLPAIDLAAGEHTISLPAEGLPAGIYTLRVTAEDAATAIKVLVE